MLSAGLGPLADEFGEDDLHKVVLCYEGGVRGRRKGLLHFRNLIYIAVRKTSSVETPSNVEYSTRQRVSQIYHCPGLTTACNHAFPPRTSSRLSSLNFSPNSRTIQLGISFLHDLFQYTGPSGMNSISVSEPTPEPRQ